MFPIIDDWPLFDYPKVHKKHKKKEKNRIKRLKDALIKYWKAYWREYKEFLYQPRDFYDLYHRF